MLIRVFFVDKEGTIWERKDKDAKTLTKRGNLPNLTPGSFSNSFHYDTALGVSEPERLKEELTKGGKILEIYLAESAKARGVSLPDTTISLTDKKLFP